MDSVMELKQIATELRRILDRADVESYGLISRKMSPEHNSEVEVLLEHVSLLVADLRFNISATNNELFAIRTILEQ